MFQYLPRHRAGLSLMPPAPAGQDGMYGNEAFSVYLRFEGDSDRFSDLGDQGLRGYTEKI